MYPRFTRSCVDLARYDDVIQIVPEVIAAIRALRGVNVVRVSVDRATGRTLSLITLETMERAQFSRDRLSRPWRVCGRWAGNPKRQIYYATG